MHSNIPFIIREIMSRLYFATPLVLLLIIVLFWEPAGSSTEIFISQHSSKLLEKKLEKEIEEVIQSQEIDVNNKVRTLAVKTKIKLTRGSDIVERKEDVLILRHKKEKRAPEWKSPRGPVPVQQQWVVKNSTHGVYMYLENGKYKDSVLVVLGGNLYDETAELVERGYTVWRMNEPCSDSTKSKKSTKCHEQYGYLGYLSDPTAPKHEVVNFIHGHKYAWHQQYGFKGMEIASHCALKTGRFEPHVKHEAHYRYSTYREFAGNYGSGGKYRPVVLAKRIRMQATTVMWNKHYGSFIRNISTTGRVMHWCCANFAVPRRMIELHSHDDYKKVFDVMATKQQPVMELEMSGFWIERIWHLLFGEPQDVEPRSEPWVNCTDESYSPQHFDPIR